VRDFSLGGVFISESTFFRMKASLLLLLATAGALVAQAPVPVPSPQPIRPPGKNVLAATEGNLTRFDLDFGGGSPPALVDALRHALGKQVNVVIVDTAAKVRLPPLRVRNVTVKDVFDAISTASRREVSVPNGYKVLQSGFTPTGGPITDDTVWSFVSNESELEEQSIALNRPKRELAHFQLRDYLKNDLTVEDITTAIRTGWEMLGVKESPDLKFHKETGIMIAAGDPKLLQQIPLVLKELPRSPSDDSAFPSKPKPNLPPLPVPAK
jgi:hypothetical protein